jgi:hypothetical protein
VNRGQALSKLSRFEYDTLIQIKEDSTSGEVIRRKGGRHKAKKFCFDAQFDLAARYGQFLRAKQKTVILPRNFHHGQVYNQVTIVRTLPPSQIERQNKTSSLYTYLLFVG